MTELLPWLLYTTATVMADLRVNTKRHTTPIHRLRTAPTLCVRDVSSGTATNCRRVRSGTPMLHKGLCSQSDVRVRCAVAVVVAAAL